MCRETRRDHVTSACRLALTVALVVVCFSPQTLGQGRYRFSLDFGYRLVFNESGNQDLYRSQVNLGEGVKLFAAEFRWIAPTGSSGWIDSAEMRMNDWGGEPYNTAQVILSKQDVYRFTFDYLNVQYFSSIPQFANPFFEEGNFESQHRADISRRMLRFRVDLIPNRRISPFVVYERGTRQGPIVTTLAAGGDEFEIRSDTEISSDDIRGGATFKLRDNLTLFLEQGFRWFRDGTHFSQSGFQEGNSDRDLLGEQIFLDGYSARNDFEGTIPYSTALLNWRPDSTLSVRAKMAYSMSDSDPTFDEETSGNFFATQPLAMFYPSSTGDAVGKVKKPNLYGDFSADWQPHWRVAVQERFSFRKRHISGDSLINRTFFNVDPLLSPDTIDQLDETLIAGRFLSVDQYRQEILGIIGVNREFSLRVGYRYQKQEADLDGDEFSRSRNILILGAGLRFSARNNVTVDYEYGNADDPILRTDTVDSHRLRLRLRLTPIDSVQINGNFNLFDNADDLPEIDLEQRNRDYGLQVSYVPTDRISFSADYQRTNFYSNLIFIVPQTFEPGRSIYRERGDFASAFLSLRLFRDSQLSLGYSFWDIVGTFPLRSHRPLARLEVPVTRDFSAYAEWNSFDYKERTSIFPQEYQAQLLTFGIRISLGSEP